MYNVQCPLLGLLCDCVFTKKNVHLTYSFHDVFIPVSFSHCLGRHGAHDVWYLYWLFHEVQVKTEKITYVHWFFSQSRNISHVMIFVLQSSLNKQETHNIHLLFVSSGSWALTQAAPKASRRWRASSRTWTTSSTSWTRRDSTRRSSGRRWTSWPAFKWARRSPISFSGCLTPTKMGLSAQRMSWSFQSQITTSDTCDWTNSPICHVTSSAKKNWISIKIPNVRL